MHVLSVLQKDNLCRLCSILHFASIKQDRKCPSVNPLKYNNCLNKMGTFSSVRRICLARINTAINRNETWATEWSTRRSSETEEGEIEQEVEPNNVKLNLEVETRGLSEWQWTLRRGFGLGSGRGPQAWTWGLRQIFYIFYIRIEKHIGLQTNVLIPNNNIRVWADWLKSLFILFQGVYWGRTWMERAKTKSIIKKLRRPGSPCTYQELFLRVAFTAPAAPITKVNDSTAH